jgi:hypothetical protein
MDAGLFLEEEDRYPVPFIHSAKAIRGNTFKEGSGAERNAKVYILLTHSRCFPCHLYVCPAIPCLLFSPPIQASIFPLLSSSYLPSFVHI